MSSKVCLVIYLYLDGIGVFKQVLGLHLGVQLLQSFQLQGALYITLPLDPLDPAGSSAPDRRYRLALRARHRARCPQPVTPSAAYVLNIYYFRFHVLLCMTAE